MADHEFFGTLSVSDAPTASDHVSRKGELDAAVSTINTALGGKAATSHTHSTTDVTGLQTYVDGRVQLVVDAAPSALNTLKEIADAIGDDPNYAATITGLITALDGRVDILEANAGTGVYRANVGDGTSKVITVTHSLGTQDVDVIVRRVSDRQRVYPVDTAPTTNTVVLDFGSGTAPTTGQYRVSVVAS